MSFHHLSQQDQSIIRNALNAMESGQILEDFEFDGRIGVSFEEFQYMVNQWPDIDDSDNNSPATLAINNTLNDILYGVGLSEEKCLQMIASSQKDIREVYRRWADSRGWSSTGVR